LARWSAGLIVPPAVVPTIWVLQGLSLFKTMPGLILIEIAYRLPFCILLFRAFVATVPLELDEAAVVDGAGSVQVFFRVIFPVLRSVIMTVIILQTVAIYNVLKSALYFLPGTPTVQLTLFNLQSQFTTQYKLLFASILLVTVPPLIMFIFFNRKIVEGMAAGSVKG
jgi:raffinose/stachyose/melibiose transport system permease protein